MPNPNCSANVIVKNNAATVADISICHYIGGDSQVTFKTWKGVPPGATTSDPFVVHYVLHDRNLDWWYCELTTNGVLYHSAGSWSAPDKECLLEEADNGKTLIFGASTTQFDMNMPSDGCSTGMFTGGIVEKHEKRKHE
jgi:hypothetical protein